MKKEVAIAERKLIARNERIQSLESLLQDSQEKLTAANHRYVHSPPCHRIDHSYHMAACHDRSGETLYGRSANSSTIQIRSATHRGKRAPRSCQVRLDARTRFAYRHDIRRRVRRRRIQDSETVARRRRRGRNGHDPHHLELAGAGDEREAEQLVLQPEVVIWSIFGSFEVTLFLPLGTIPCPHLPLLHWVRGREHREIHTQDQQHSGYSISSLLTSHDVACAGHGHGAWKGVRQDVKLW